MDLILHRFRNLTILLAVLAAQLVLLAYQVKTGQDMRLIRVWSVSAVTPLARLVEFVRGGVAGFLRDYVILWNARAENVRLREELGRLKLENQFLKTELSTAERARALAAFQLRTPSKTLAARIIANASGANSKVVYVDRGVTSGVQPGMAVVTPDGIVGKVLSVYPTASQVMLISDPSFAAGVISEKHRVHGVVKGQGHGTLIVDYVPAELKVEPGEKFYTSGDDRIFPKGFPVGEVKVVRPGRMFKEIFLAPSGFAQGLEEVLIVVEGVHQPLPGSQPFPSPFHVLAPPEPDPAETALPAGAGPLTEAGRLKQYYRQLGASQGLRFGEKGAVPNFNAPMSAPAPAAVPSAISRSNRTPQPGDAAAQAPPTALSR